MSSRWKQGQSGNPKGRPVKERAITTLLEKGGSKTVDLDGKRVSGKRLLVRYVWEALLYGQVTLAPLTPDAKPEVLIFSPSDWKDLVKWLYAQVDGPPKVEADIDHALTIKIVDSTEEPSE